MAKKILYDPRNKSLITKNCKECGDRVEKVDSKADGVICWKCVMKMCGGSSFEKPEESEDNINNS